MHIIKLYAVFQLSVSINANSAILFDSGRPVEDVIYQGQFREDDEEGIDVPFFDLGSILAATDNFSEANKLGQGGFGSVYKVMIHFSWYLFKFILT